MAIRIASFEMITFEIPDGKGKIVELTVPPLDCFDPRDVKQMNAELKKIKQTSDNPEADDYIEAEDNPNKDPAAMIRFMLNHFNPTKAKRDAIALLVRRQLKQIDDEWLK